MYSYQTLWSHDDSIERRMTWCLVEALAATCPVTEFVAAGNETSHEDTVSSNSARCEGIGEQHTSLLGSAAGQAFHLAHP